MTGRLISVDALIDAHCGECAFYHDGKCHALFPCNFRRFIDEDVTAMPAVDAEPVRHGRWIMNDNGTYSCSECHSWIPNEQHYYARYCLFCGAKMDGEA